MTAIGVLKQFFGYDEFRVGQASTIEALMHGRDVLGVMPTGAGKSLCYQVPAMLLPGVTLVVSPLISLMRDQVQALVANGIPAAYINSSLTEAQCQRAMENARVGKYKIIYVAPERLLTFSMLALAQGVDVSLVAVDEAHCISQWGQDFRPAYLDIPKFVAALPRRPALAAFTATATPHVQADIREALGLQDPFITVTGFDRANLYFEVKRPKDKYGELIRYLEANDAAGIVYCSTRKEVESVSEWLIADGYSAARYHAGLSDAERSQSQDDFLYDRVRIIVATNAFGMGIDKSNVRFVIHYNMPQNVESYYQEAGRAGRDGLPADCLLFYARKDVTTALFLIRQSSNFEEIARNRRLLNQMEHYCETDACLRQYMLNYFGEQGAQSCGNCGNCTDTHAEIDATDDAKKILSHISLLNGMGKRFMFTHTADIALGKSGDFTDLATFGIVQGSTRQHVRKITNRLTMLGYIHDDGYLRVTPKAEEVLHGDARITIRKDEPQPTQGKRSRRAANNAQMHAVSDALLAKLKKLRLEIAGEERVPAYIIFSDATLVDMCRLRPQDEEAFLQVSGVGRVKLGRYGQRFLELLRAEAPAEEKEAPLPEFTPEILRAQVEIENDSIPISRVADGISAVLVRHGKPKVTAAALNRLLLEAGYIRVVDDAKSPTFAGHASGIVTIDKTSNNGTPYTQCLFGPDAQRICIELVVHELSRE